MVAFHSPEESGEAGGRLVFKTGRWGYGFLNRRAQLPRLEEPPSRGTAQKIIRLIFLTYSFSLGEKDRFAGTSTIIQTQQILRQISL